jgi:hypothetical protein
VHLSKKLVVEIFHILYILFKREEDCHHALKDEYKVLLEGWRDQRRDQRIIENADVLLDDCGGDLITTKSRDHSSHEIAQINCDGELYISYRQRMTLEGVLTYLAAFLIID